jgi:hypothetical protein
MLDVPKALVVLGLVKATSVGATVDVEGFLVECLYWFVPFSFGGALPSNIGEVGLRGVVSLVVGDVTRLRMIPSHNFWNSHVVLLLKLYTTL